MNSVIISWQFFFTLFVHKIKKIKYIYKNLIQYIYKINYVTRYVTKINMQRIYYTNNTINIF